MHTRSGIIDRTSPLEPLIFIAIVSLAVSWGMQPLIQAALSAQGALVQQSAAAALWISAALSPFAAFGKAVVAAAICWAVATFIDEPLPLGRLVTMFVVAETVFVLRDIVAWGVLVTRAVPSVHSPSDLSVHLGLNAFLPPMTGPLRLAVESWDVFHVAWAIVLFVLLRAVFGRSTGSAACLALIALASRVLFSAVTLMYSA
jgi:hypothetical protein